MKILPFVMPGFPSIGDSRDVFRFLQTQPDVIIETALPTLAPTGSALVQKVRKIVNRAGIKPDDVMATFRKDRKTQKAMLMLHAEPEGHDLSQIRTAFDYAIAPFDAPAIARLNTLAGSKTDAPFTQFGGQVAPDDEQMEAKVKASEGFIYLTVAPQREGDLFSEEKIKTAIEKIKTVKDIEVFCGFGVKTSDDVRMLKSAGADGVFLGAEALHAQEKGLTTFKPFWQTMQAAAEG
ncbi:tryptophan synthase subunit alpha [Candidatus Micrarchaeota archaeon]|nr:tryptophan synthase subunit alpha [Candidatus Micrarchaeota archaeon]